MFDKKLLKQPTYEPFVPDQGKVSFLNILGGEPSPKDRVINDRFKLRWVMGILRQEGKTVGYTSGVYDLLHDGHVKYLAEGKKHCDVLIVALDEDELVKIRKRDNPNRPYDDLMTRLILLTHNRSVNILTVRYAGERLEQAVMDLLPDVAIFSRSTRDTQNFEGDIRASLKEYAGKIVFLDPQSGNSTTSKMGKIKEDGAHELEAFLLKDLKGKIPDRVLQRSLKKFFENQKEGA